MLIIRKARLGLSALPLLVGLLTIACASQTATPAPASPRGAGSSQGQSTIAVGDNTFTPSVLTVRAGTAVTWNFAGARNPHSVVGTYDGASVDSGRQTGSGTYQFTFATPGTFQYQCGVHGAGMAGRVVVE
jgi:plastocyanin